MPVTFDPVSSLDERDRIVIGYRMLGYTLQQIADMFDLSVERIRIIEIQAWSRIHRAYYKQWFHEQHEPRELDYKLWQ
jgi:DNA-directed RNA polymerase sigma subunit (sigma70/sigma32)